MESMVYNLISETFNHFLVDVFIIGKATTAQMNCWKPLVKRVSLNM